MNRKATTVHVFLDLSSKTVFQLNFLRHHPVNSSENFIVPELLTGYNSRALLTLYVLLTDVAQLTCTGCRVVLILPIPSTVVTAIPSTAHSGSKQQFAEKCIIGVKVDGYPIDRPSKTRKCQQTAVQLVR